MAKYVIEGGSKLKGRVKISGNKNAILPCLAATLLTEEEVILRNVPSISDVDIFLQIFQRLGVDVEVGDHLLKVRCKNINKHEIPEDLANKLRASILLVGPMLARFKKIEFPHPGGDVIGKRSIETHLEGFKKLGYEFEIKDRLYKGKSNGFSKEKKKKIFLDEASVTATENLILTSVLGQADVTLKNCAMEPHVVDLCNLLIEMGAKIEGVGSPTLKIQGVSKLHAADFTIGSDHIEFGTFAIAAALTGGEIEIEKTFLQDIDCVICNLEKMGLEFKEKDEFFTVSCPGIKSIPKLVVALWPGFPTDLMSVMIVLASQAKGVSLLHDWMYESRMFFADKLISMGAHITIADPHRVLVYGPTKLYGRNMETPDIRAGMALVLAALVAEGKSVIDRAELIERGYEGVVEKLTALGANIQKVE